MLLAFCLHPFIYLWLFLTSFFLDCRKSGLNCRKLNKKSAIMFLQLKNIPFHFIAHILSLEEYSLMKISLVQLFSKQVILVDKENVSNIKTSSIRQSEYIYMCVCIAQPKCRVVDVSQNCRVRRVNSLQLLPLLYTGQTSRKKDHEALKRVAIFSFIAAVCLMEKGNG